MGGPHLNPLWFFGGIFLIAVLISWWIAFFEARCFSKLGPKRRCCYHVNRTVMRPKKGCARDTIEWDEEICCRCHSLRYRRTLDGYP